MTCREHLAAAAVIYSAFFLPASALSGRPAPPARVREFVSRSAGYEVDYPADWHIMPVSAPTLYIVNFPPAKRVRAVVLPKGGASISLLAAPPGVSTAEQWLARDVKPLTELLSKTNVTIPTRTGTQLEATEATLLWATPNPSFEGVNSYVTVSGRLFSGRLTYWKDDPRAAEYIETLRRVLGSLRLTSSHR